MQKSPKISVLMSAYNTEKYIAESIESILNQTFKDFEFIIINDGSTDNTAKIIKEYAKRDKRIKFINFTKNQGLITSLNKGLKYCNGKYIARMDSDDISYPERFEKQFKYMEQHQECGALGAWIKKFGPNIKKNEVYKYSRNMKLLDFFIYGNQMAQPVSMIRKSVIIDNNIKYDPRYKHAEDYDFWIQITKHSEIHTLQEVLLDYRWHGENVSVLYKKIQSENAEIIRKNLLSELLSSKKDIEKLLRMTREIHERFYLFGFLPIVRRKQYSITKTKYYLFEKIPFIKEQDGKIYLFEKFKIGIIK